MSEAWPECPQDFSTLREMLTNEEEIWRNRGTLRRILAAEVSRRKTCKQEENILDEESEGWLPLNTLISLDETNSGDIKECGAMRLQMEVKIIDSYRRKSSSRRTPDATARRGLKDNQAPHQCQDPRRRQTTR